jgi:hypothetical protein
MATPKKAAAQAVADAGAFVELGATGLKRFGGIIADEFLPELRGRRGRQILREMAENDPIIGAGLSVIGQMLRRVNLRVEDGDTDTQGLMASELIRTSMEDMSFTWNDTLTEIDSFLAFGFSVMEVVPKRRLGQNPGTIMNSEGKEIPLPTSKYDDGLIGWRKWGTRSQESLYEWGFDDSPGGDGGLKSFTQQPAPTYRTITIPIEKLLLFRTKLNRNNPEGYPLIRNSYIPWYAAKQFRFAEAVGVTRDLCGMPEIKIPGDIIQRANATPPDAAAQAVVAAYVQMGRDLTAGDQTFIILPSDRDDHGNEKYSFKLVTTGGRQQYNTRDIIMGQQKEMLIAMLCDFILLGHERVGSHALSVSKSDTFALAIQGWLNARVEVINRYAIPRLLALNGFQPKAPPYLSAGDVESVNLLELGPYIAALSGAFPLGFDAVPGLMDALLEAAHLPTSEDTQQVGKRTTAQVMKARKQALKRFEDAVRAKARRQIEQEEKGNGVDHAA